MKQKLDPIIFATLANRLDSVVREAMQTCIQTSRSAVIQARDLSASVCDRQGRLVSIAQGLPIHVLTSNMAVEPIPKLFDDIAPGDCFLNNSPFHGAGHHADYTFCTPVFFHGRLVFWVLLRVHQADTGAPEPTVYLPLAKDIYEEGLHWPCVRVQRDYKNLTDVLRIGLSNIRVPEQWFGDFASAVGSTRTAEKRLVALVERYGVDTTEQFIEEWLEYGSRRMAEEIKTLPQGTWENETTLDPLPFAPEGITIGIKLTIDHENEEMVVDLTGNPDQFEAGINLTEATSKASVMEGIFWCLDPTLPHNSGAFDRVKFKLREGSIAGVPRFPVGTSVATDFTADRMACCAIALMAKVDPDKGGGEGGYVSLTEPVFSGKDPRRNDAPYVDQMIIPGALAGGGPGVKGYDGWLTWMIGACMGNMWTTSVELWEKKYPQVVDCGAQIVHDSEGAGEFIGGPGGRVVTRSRDNPTTVSAFGDGKVFPPAGVLGGESGAPNLAYILDEEGRRIRDLPMVGLFEIPPGHSLEGLIAGGGGYGDPLDRDPERVRRDVRKGWVTAEKARGTYGVVLDLGPELFAVDHPATAKLRDEMRRDRGKVPKRSKNVGAGLKPAGRSTQGVHRQPGG